jgi:hypothetical protein
MWIRIRIRIRIRNTGSSNRVWQATIIKGKPYRLEIDPPGLNSGIQPVQGVAHREGSEGSSHQRAKKWEKFVKIHNSKPPLFAYR